MDLLTTTYDYALAHGDALLNALQQHLLLVALPLALGVGLGVPLGLWSARSRWVSVVVLNGFNALRVIPSLAVLFLAIPVLGLTLWSAVLALTLLVMPPILISTDVAFRTISPAVLEAATGLGMTAQDRLRRIEIPLALPVVLAGVKTATVEVIASATLAAFVGAGGLGRFIVLGFAAYDPAILLVGAIPVALLALGTEISFTLIQRLVEPPRG
ncbi:MAG: ABC transporter permease [Leptolyngbya sp.]|nr:ABC transporter permease [Leptolyngbya sp.]